MTGRPITPLKFGTIAGFDVDNVYRNPGAYVNAGPDFGDGIERVDWNWSKYKVRLLILEIGLIVDFLGDR